MASDQIISPIFIDFGSRNTGVILLHGKVNQSIFDWQKSGSLIVADENKKTWAQISRRIKRHQKRNIERRQMAKRLLLIILKEVFAFTNNELETTVNQNQTALQFMTGLLNRRGYTRLDEGVDREAINNLDIDLIKEHDPSFADYLSSFSTVSEAIESAANLSLQEIDDFLNHPAFEQVEIIKGRSVRRRFAILEKVPTELKKPLETGLSATLKALESYKLALDEGHKRRPEYFNDIKEVISANAQFVVLLEKKGLDVDSFHRLISNISNLQLRMLRKYFNDPSFKSGDRWYPEKLKNVFSRYVQSWHARNKKEKANKKEILARLQSTPDIINLLASLDPQITIPPYEDQNNRSPLKCRSLLLDHEKLDQTFPNWKFWTEKIVSKYPEITEELEARQVGHTQPSRNAPKEVRILQRFLEASNHLQETYNLRKVARSDSKSDFDDQLQALANLLGGDQIDSFLNLARRIFDEVHQARYGIWNELSNTRILTRCDITTRTKANSKEIDLARVLGTKKRAGVVNEFENLLRKGEKINRKSLKSVLQSCSDWIKREGSLFKEKVQLIQGGQTKDFDNKLIELVKVGGEVDKAASLIAGHFGVDEDKINNPWSLSQIFNIYFSTRAGHSSSCAACSGDNFWRTRTNSNHQANCSSLPTDAVRPFDGVVRRLVEDFAHAIARKKLEQIGTSSSVLVPVVIEENRFSSAEDLLVLKRSQNLEIRSDRRSFLKKARVSDEQMFQNKIERIQSASRSICPYSGQKLIQDGEIDHVIPRSYTLKHFKSVLNHEANLIYASKTGNQSKLNSIFNLEDLHPKYLEAQFGTNDISKIAKTIQSTIESLLEEDRLRLQFLRLKEQEQRDLRHALFVPDLRKTILPKLAQQSRNWANGTQRYLAKVLQREICKRNPNADVQIQFADPVETSILRDNLAKQDVRLTKQENQPIISHLYDAMIGGLSNIWVSENISKEITTALIDADSFYTLLPRSFDVFTLSSRSKAKRDNPFSKSMFKDEMYAEHFLPVWLSRDGNLGFGFNPNELIICNPNKSEQIWSALTPFLIGPKQTEPADFKKEISTRKEKWTYYTVNKNKAFQFFNKHALQPDPETQIVWETLNSLRFTTQKMEFFDIVFKEEKKKNSRELLSVSEFEKQHKAKKFTLERSSLGKGIVVIPSYHEWTKRIEELRHDRIVSIPLDEFELTKRELGRNYFLDGTSANKRMRARKQFSLPMLKNASGGFRIERTNFLSESIYQLQSIDDLSAVGVLKSDKRTYVPVPGLLSGSITPLSAEFRISEDFISFDEWFDVNVDARMEEQGITKLRVQYGTKDRRNVELTVKPEKLLELFDLQDSDIFKIFRTIDFRKSNLPKKVGRPRDKCTVVRVDLDEGITVRYSAESASELTEEIFKLANI